MFSAAERELLAALSDGLAGCQSGAGERALSPGPFPEAQLRRLLGQGDLRVALADRGLEETRLAGIWYETSVDGGLSGLRVSACPQTLERQLSLLSQRPLTQRPWFTDEAARELVRNIKAAVRRYLKTHVPQVINLAAIELTSAQWQLLLDWLLGDEVTLSGHHLGDFRLRSTRLPCVWYGQYQDHRGQTLLQTFEIAQVPEACQTAMADLENSRQRLQWLLAQP